MTRGIQAYYGSVSQIISIGQPIQRCRPVAVEEGVSEGAALPSKGLKDTAKAAEQAVTWLDKFKDP